MSRNFGFGSRDMKKAAENAMRETAASFSSVASNTQRFEKFNQYAKDEGVGRLERVDAELVKSYGEQLAERVERGEMSAAYAQNLVSSVNVVMRTVTRGAWRSVSPTRDCNIAQREHVRNTPTPSKLDIAKLAVSDRQAAIVNLAQNFGLRSKEASLLNAKNAYAQALKNGVVTIKEGTKGGRTREITITSQKQIETLKSAAQAQENSRAVMPSNENWKSWRENGLREVREIVAESSSARGLHDFRASYAAERYEALVGHPAPCNHGVIVDRQADYAARLQIAGELGHGRIDVVSSYIGGRG